MRREGWRTPRDNYQRSTQVSGGAARGDVAEKLRLITAKFEQSKSWNLEPPAPYCSSARQPGPTRPYTDPHASPSAHTPTQLTSSHNL